MKTNRIIGVVLGLVLALGTFFLGVYSSRFFSWGHSSRLNAILQLVGDYYVDTLNMDSIEERAIPVLLSNLDPHSVYLSAEMNRQESEGLDGSFQGIGVQFNTLKDTVIVVRVIEGGASERAGLQPGDRIVRADTTSLIGKDIPSEKVFKALKGPEGSVVKLKIIRSGSPMEVSVVRGPVPVSSIDAAYMLRPHILYVRLNKWGAVTHQEFLNAFARHYKEDIKGVVLDLRDNAGGYLESAVALASEFLPEGKTVAYTEGRKYPKEDFVTRKDGLLKDLPLVVLVNEFSASSSEIFSGAMQDHDRALIIGRRTFGKGLVQRPFMLSDSSVIRLTVARYYTPSGRCVQKSYANGLEAYQEDILARYQHGELSNADSMVVKDSTVYYTDGKRPVHGGGGITPDVFVARDSTGVNSYYLRLISSGTMPQFAFFYADRNRTRLATLGSAEKISSYLQEQGLLFDYAYYAQGKGIPIRTSLLQQSSPLIMRNLKALIADNVSPDRSAFFEILNKNERELTLAVEAIEQGSWKPKLGK